ncbi:hypothetical protein CsSME_00016352 [Camellia sinensis var. sinensis]
MRLKTLNKAGVIAGKGAPKHLPLSRLLIALFIGWGFSSKLFDSCSFSSKLCITSCHLCCCSFSAKLVSQVLQS